MGLHTNNFNRPSLYRLVRLWSLVGLVAATVGCATRISWKSISPDKHGKELTLSQTLLVKSSLTGLRQSLSTYQADFEVLPVQSSGDSDSIKATGSALGSGS